MKSLQDWGLMGEIYIGCGFIRGKLAGIYYDILGRVGGRLAGGRGLLQGLVSTARRGGVPFVRTRRRGLCSMSGRYPYGIGNPPTLRRSSFPQRASRPAGGPIPKHAWGCAPRPPNAKLRLDTNDVNIVRTAPQIRSQGACGAFYFGFCRDRIKINTL